MLLSEPVLNSPNLQGIFPFTEQYHRYTASLLGDPEIRGFLPNEMKPETAGTKDKEPLSKLRIVLIDLLDSALIPSKGFLFKEGSPRRDLWLLLVVHRSTRSPLV
jgi:hypothetical protein